MNKIKAVIFDMDGVLIDAKEWHYEALNKALNYFEYNINNEEHLLYYDGLPTKKKLEILSEKKGLSPKLYDQINEMKQKYTLEIIQEKCKPLEAHQIALQNLKNEGYLLGLASNSVRKTVDLMLTKANLKHYFDIILSNQDVKNPKPNPEIYNTVISKFDLTPRECLILEDNINGVKAAIESGAYLLEIEKITDVTYGNIKNKIKEIEF